MAKSAPSRLARMWGTSNASAEAAFAVDDRYHAKGLRVSRLAVEVPEIVELDLNPVMALPSGHGCRIVDARIRVRETM